MPLTTYPNIRDGRKVVTTAGTRERLVSTNTPCKKVTITALYENTDMIVLGDVTVVASVGTRRGTPLVAGQSITLDVEDLYTIYLDSVVSGEGVSYSYQF